jgi:hypothetical protein
MKIMSFLLLMFSLSAYAGDNYFVCADLANDEEFIVDEYFSDDSEAFSSMFKNPDQENIWFIVTFNPRDRMMSVVSLDRTTGIQRFVKTSKLEYYEYENITNRIACMITD